MDRHSAIRVRYNDSFNEKRVMTTPSLDALRHRVQQQLALYVPADSKQVLMQAMHYAVMNGGKRLRPLLVYLSGLAAGAQLEDLDRPAVAVEIIHAYSLVHDDLPAMDDDDLRRGQPTCHRVYGEAMAILAGDAMQALAFDILATEAQVNAVSLMSILAKACGASGMAGGQALDLMAVGQSLTQAQLDYVHTLKTGVLIEAAMLMGCRCGDLSDDLLQSFKTMAHFFGLLYQVQDDIFDVEISAQVRGKLPGGDARLAKPTYPAILGMRQAKQVQLWLSQQLQAALDSLPPSAKPLQDYVTTMMDRGH